jgi:MFS transporter, PAT family, solute carrier family 33 (acetyl-CoA transportor), member 1
MLLLLILYTLQGIPMGLSGSIPLLLNERGASYSALGVFSVVSVPFSLKLLWAPIVDSVYVKSIGRRKTWLVPIQLLAGLIMIWHSADIGTWLGGSTAGSAPPDIMTLTFFFAVLYFLMATQDIAVDGWALTMLSRENVGFASTVNSIGQILGFFLANQGFIALSDAGWCQRFLGTPEGYAAVSLSSFVATVGWVFLLVTALLAFLKREAPLPPEEEPEGVLVTYKHVYSLLQLKSVQTLGLVLLTFKLAFAPADSVAVLKMQDNGMPKSDIATFSPILLVVGLVLPAILANWVSHDPIQAVMWSIPAKLCTTGLFWLLIRAVPAAYAGGARPSASFFSGWLLVSIGHEIADKIIFTAFMAFFAKVSDPAIGGTYMTFLNTVANLGFRWSNSLAIWAVGALDGVGGADAYTTLTLFAVAYGVVWIFAMYPSLRRLEKMPAADWEVRRAKAKGRRAKGG